MKGCIGMFEAEKIKYSIEAGEVHAPVSSIYKKFIKEMLQWCVYDSEGTDTLHYFNVNYIKKMLEKDAMFKKTPKQFQQEVYDLLDIPFETLYEIVKGKPLKVNTEVGTNIDNKPKLKLVK